MRITREEWALSLAAITAKRGTCLRRQVGCVLLNRRGHVVATGYNGVAAGLPHCNEVTGLQSRGDGQRGLDPIYGQACEGACSPSGMNLDACHAVHAEQNALLQCHDVYAVEACYVTCSPCVTCTKLLLNTGCQTIVFAEAYAHDQTARQLWEDAGRKWIQIK